jgi:hypothetical protein
MSPTNPRQNREKYMKLQALKPIVSMALIALLSLFIANCSSGPKREALKAEKLTTELKDSEAIDGNSKVGTDQDKNVVVNEQTSVVEFMHNLENEVKMQNDEIYGTPDFNSKGLAGQLMDCYRKNRKNVSAADAEEVPALPSEMQADIQEYNKAFKKEKSSEGSSTEVGYNEKGQLVRNRTEDLHLRVERFQKIKAQLMVNKNKIEYKLADCKASQRQ